MPLCQSEQINELAAALCEAQRESLFALADSANPFFKSKYADLSSVWNVIREPLTKNGLAVTQTMDYDCDGATIIVTTLMHRSGQWKTGKLKIKPVKDDPQSLGSAITYGRRYSLSAMVGVCPEDDDGNVATGKKDAAKGASKQPDTGARGPGTVKAPPQAPTEAQLKSIITVGKKNGLEGQKLKDLVEWYWKNNSHDGRTFEAARALEFGFGAILERYRKGSKPAASPGPGRAAFEAARLNCPDIAARIEAELKPETDEQWQAAAESVSAAADAEVPG